MTVKDEKLVTTEELGEMDAQTSYLSPIFGSYASDVEMPETKLNQLSHVLRARSFVSTLALKVMLIKIFARLFRLIWSLKLQSL